MITAEYIKRQKKERRKSSTQFRLRLELLAEHQETLDRLPKELSLSLGGYSKVHPIYLTAYLGNDEDVKRVTAEIRAVLGVKESVKQLSDDHMSYTTENDVIRTTVYGGDIPTNCRLIPESHSYITYTMECGEENES